MEKLKIEAIAKQTILNESKEKNEAEKKQAQTDFNNAMKTRKNDIDILTAKAEKTPEEVTQLSEHNTKYEEMKSLITQEESEIIKAEKETSTACDYLKNIVTQEACDLLNTYKGKERSEIKAEGKFKEYVNAMQIIVTILGASTGLGDTLNDDKSYNNFGPITRAGIKTIQNYLNKEYGAKLIPDGLPGPLTLSALLAPVSSTDPTTRLQKMLDDNIKLTPLPVEKPIAHKNKETGKGEAKKDNATILQATKTLAVKNDPEGLNATLELQQIEKKLLKEFPTLRKDLRSERAKGIQEQKLQGKTVMWEKTIAGKKYYFNQYMYFTPIKSDADKYEKTLNPKNQSNITETIKPETQEKNIINKENQLNNAKVEDSVLNVISKKINENLSKHIIDNPIKFQEEKHNQYYKDKFQSKKINCMIKSNLSGLSLSIGDRKINLQPNDFLKKDNGPNYETIKEAIIKEITKEIEKKEETEAEKLESKKYKALKNYLEGTYFGINTIYPKYILNRLGDGDQILIEAFFKSFKNELEFSRGESEYDKQNKKIVFKFKNTKEYKNQRGKMNIDDKISADGTTLDEVKIKENIRGIIDAIIIRDYPEYKKNIGKITIKKKDNIKEESKKNDTTSANAEQAE